MAYDLKTARAPRLSGWRLAVVARLAECPMTRGFLLPALLEAGGVPAFRRAVLTEDPSFAPSFPSTPADGGGRGAQARESLESAGPDTPTPFETVADFTRAYRERRALPEDIADRVLGAVERSNRQEPALGAITAWKADEIRATARAASQRYREGCPLSPLDGVPITIKDEFDVLGYATTAGTRFRTALAKQDAVAVARLRAAGAVIIGKANMHEIGIDTTGFNAHFGTARNPFAMDRYTGGSSSGSAAAVAAGLVPLALGADGGGSIRIPAALCGIVGLKPTFGRISTHGGASLCWSVAHAGPMGASVADVALGYALLSESRGINPAETAWPSLNGEVGSFEGLRIGIYPPWFEDADPEVVSTCRAHLALLEARGARLVEIELPDLELCRVAQAVTILSEMVTSAAGDLRGHRGEFSWGVRLMLAMAGGLSARDYVLAQQVRSRFAAHTERAFSQVDVIATPTTARTAPPIRSDVFPRGESDLDVTSALMRFVFPWNLTGHPALTHPVGYDAKELPIGLQWVGPAWSEALLLRVAAKSEHLVKRRTPAGYCHLLE